MLCSCRGARIPARGVARRHRPLLADRYGAEIGDRPRDGSSPPAQGHDPAFARAAAFTCRRWPTRVWKTPDPCRAPDYFARAWRGCVQRAPMHVERRASERAVAQFVHALNVLPATRSADIDLRGGPCPKARAARRSRRRHLTARQIIDGASLRPSPPCDVAVSGEPMARASGRARDSSRLRRDRCHLPAHVDDGKGGGRARE